MVPERFSITARRTRLHLNRRLGRALLLAAGLLAGGRDARAQTSLFDPRLDEVRHASVEWDRRLGPDRAVVDVVCLVPDVPTFFEAIAAWDDRHFFPILIDDVEYTFKFLRAFHPARIVRFPSKARPIPPEALWDRAISAVGNAWRDEKSSGEVPRGDSVPKALGATPPGVVLSTPDSPMLPGAAALAAGRFQPLWKWSTAPKRFADHITADDAAKLAQSIEALVTGHGLRYDKLGDDCDFVTLAGDYPYRYDRDGQGFAFDDLILRSTADKKPRWGFAGRLTGDATTSVYRAMCALFLRPGSATLFNSYGERDDPWTRYAMGPAATRLGQLMPSAHRNAGSTGLLGWHEAFDPINRAGLLLINSSGGPFDFRIDEKNNQAQTADIPESVPAIVHMIHSFSAEIPEDAASLAGRWLANGAYIYYGSMNEPYLEAFRSAGAITAFLSDNLPLSAAFRRLATEPFGQPWRLVYFGDPLHRIRPSGGSVNRLPAWEPIMEWKAYGESPLPTADTSDFERLSWVLKTSIFRLQAGAEPKQRIDLHGILLGIARERLEPRARALHDDLVVDHVLHSERPEELIPRLSAIPPSERSPSVTRHLETAQAAALQKALDALDQGRALALWRNAVRAPGSRGFVDMFTSRTGRLADGPARKAAWIEALRRARRDAPEPAIATAIDRELERLGVKASKG